LAAILSLCARVAATAIIVFSDPTPGGWRMTLNGCTAMLIFLLSILGWAAFAFIGTKKSDHEA
jgi:hypothetical protein